MQNKVRIRAKLGVSHLLYRSKVNQGKNDQIGGQDKLNMPTT